MTEMVVLSFFFLLRLSEYTAEPSDTTPFTLADVQLFIGKIRLDTTTAFPTTMRVLPSAPSNSPIQKWGSRGSDRIEQTR